MGAAGRVLHGDGGCQVYIQPLSRLRPEIFHRVFVRVGGGHRQNGGSYPTYEKVWMHPIMLDEYQ
jgi:hypothetical protein